MSKHDIIEKIAAGGVIPVIRADSASVARECVDALIAGGITVVEVTMTVPGAVDLIAELAKDVGDDILIGAGTVLNKERAGECIAAGAKFIVSPATNFDVIEYCNGREVVIMPGALTPTEVVNAWDAGADFVKVFPAGSMGGAGYLRSLKAPLPHIKLIPTGGVSQENAADFIRAGAEAVGVGADLVDVGAIRDGKPGQITDAAIKYLEIVREARH
jgi:2-dehydro-3-deoxyphosphogluconate aldolase/(4S)-4-hydroxy-2-oxoglutarate aldolase